MSDTTAGLLQVGLLIAALVACYRPLGAYMARAYTSEHDTRVERFCYRVMGVDPKGDQRWPGSARSPLAFSAVSGLFLYGLLEVGLLIAALVACYRPLGSNQQAD